jgi:hypothetical protein
MPGEWERDPRLDLVLKPLYPGSAERERTTEAADAAHTPTPHREQTVNV